MAGLAALEMQRRRKCELEALMKSETLAKLRVELPGPKQRVEKSPKKTVLEKPFNRGIRLGR